MLQNVINSAMDWTSTTEQAIEYMQNFHYLNAREFLKRVLDKKTDMVWKRYIDKLTQVKREFVDRNIDLGQEDPAYAGKAIWAYQLIRR